MLLLNVFFLLFLGVKKHWRVTLKTYPTFKGSVLVVPDIDRFRRRRRRLFEGVPLFQFTVPTVQPAAS